MAEAVKGRLPMQPAILRRFTVQESMLLESCAIAMSIPVNLGPHRLSLGCPFNPRSGSHEASVRCRKGAMNRYTAFQI